MENIYICELEEERQKFHINIALCMLASADA